MRFFSFAQEAFCTGKQKLLTWCIIMLFFFHARSILFGGEETSDMVHYYEFFLID